MKDKIKDNRLIGIVINHTTPTISDADAMLGITNRNMSMTLTILSVMTVAFFRLTNNKIES